jgi:purine nucleosidase
MTTPPARPVLLDCDTGIDDALALLHLVGRGGRLLGVTSVHGNVPTRTGAENSLRVLDAAGVTDVPVWVGAARPMAQPLSTAEEFHGPDGLGGTVTGPPSRPVADGAAAVRIVELAQRYPREFTLVAVGPLTNLGLALLLEPALPDLIDEVVVMGGAMRPPGNISAAAEANTWHDPEAAQLVIEAPWRTTFVTLDATMRTMLPDEHLEAIARSSDPKARFAWAAMDFYLGAYQRWSGRRTCPLHDPLAMALALQPDLATYRTAQTTVELHGGATRGALVPDLRASSDARAGSGGDVVYVDDLDVERFQALFVASLTSPGPV